jgi:hypothetical protein
MKLRTIVLVIVCIKLSFAQNVIIVVVDGARYAETFGAGATYIPHLYNDLKPLGAVYTNFRIADEGKTETNPGHSSMLTGTWQQITNDGSQRPNKPTVFEYFRKELGSSIIENYAVAGKSKLNILSYSTDPDYGILYQASTNCSTLTDNQVYNNLLSIMATFHPRLMIVNFPDTDVKGHTGVWSDYLNALINADNLVYQIWQHIQGGDYGYTATNTTMFVTNDHGRHTTDFSGHGDDCDGCEHIMLLAIGRNVSQGVVINDLRFQIDLAPTIGDLLGFSTPHAVSTSLYQGPNPLPVELTSFTAKVLNSGGVKLDWRTETEVSNYGFEVERLQDFKIEKLQDWEKIGFLEGHGNSNSPKDYSFTDNSAGYGKYSYRLKQIDTDGQFEYSKKVEVDLKNSTKFELSQNYPNPFNPVTTIKFALPESGNVNLTIYNLLGEQVAEPINEFKNAGIHTINFNASELNSGVYIYKVESNGFVQSRKMTLIK